MYEMYKVPRTRVEVYCLPETVNFISQMAIKFKKNTPSQAVNEIIRQYKSISAALDDKQKQYELKQIDQLKNAEVIKK